MAAARTRLHETHLHRQMPCMQPQVPRAAQAPQGQAARCARQRGPRKLAGLRSAVSGLFHARGRPQTGILGGPAHGRGGSSGSHEKNPCNGGHAGFTVNKEPKSSSAQLDGQEDTDTDASECGEEEKAFFADLRRVRRGELIAAARIELPARTSLSQLLSLFSRKVLSSPLLSVVFLGHEERSDGTAATYGSSRSNMAPNPKNKEEGSKRSAEAERRGGTGLCEKRVLMGRRCRRKEACRLGFILERTRMEVSSFRALARRDASLEVDA